MPLIATFGSASARGFGFFTSINQINWIANLGGGSADEGEDIGVDSSGNVYVVGSSVVSGTTYAQLAKYNSSGVIQWQRKLGASSSFTVGYGIAVSPDGDVYITGLTNYGGNRAIIAKYSTSGTIQWQSTLGSVSVLGYGYGIALDLRTGYNNVYITGLTNESGYNDVLLASFNSSNGNIQWQYRLGQLGNHRGYGVAVDLSGNIYVGGYATNPSSSTNDMLILKYNSSGGNIWQRRLGTATSAAQEARGVAFDSSGNVYVGGNDTNNLMQIAKYNSSGGIQWQRNAQGSGGTASQGFGITADSSGNSYLIGYSNATGNLDYQIIKYNSSGVIQWQRRLNYSGTDHGKKIVLDSSGNMYVVGYNTYSGSIDFLFAKLPTDGSKTGTYTLAGYPVVYAASSLTDSQSTLTDTANGRSNNAATLPFTPDVLTATSSSLTSSETII